MGRSPYVLLTDDTGQHDTTLQGTPATDVINRYADRFDVLILPGLHQAATLTALRARNSNIIILCQFLPVATLALPGTLWPTTHYMRDAVTNSYCTRNSWYLLDWRIPAVRTDVLNYMLSASVTTPGVDGYWVDLSWGGYINNPFQGWNNSAFPPSATGLGNADLGNLDGGWTPAMNAATRPNFTDGTFPAAMLAFHQALRAARPNALIIYNGFESQSVYQANQFWRDQEAAYLAATDGADKEAVFALNSTTAGSESSWLFYIQRFAAAIAQGKVAQVTGFYQSNAALRLLTFCSYLLIADGQYAWLESSWTWNALFDTDIGVPDTSVNGGNYQTLPATPSGNIYKRTFTNHYVYVNPGSITRSADGQTLSPSTGVIIARPAGTATVDVRVLDNLGLPISGATVVLNPL